MMQVLKNQPCGFGDDSNKFVISFHVRREEVATQ